MVIRGSVWWIDFGDPFGSEPGYRRPGVVVSSDRFNASRISTLHIVPLTTSLGWSAAPGNVEIARGTAELPRDCVANVSQTHVVDRRRLDQRIGDLPMEIMSRIDAGLRLVFDL
ncbi:type II toxin-antitoxin system PemK/MazF family toxin [Brachybacterium sp. Marseille-Q7125]|uniref:type II toxin-antitoxin system PemK/MazF family toxin n=1 Tax=Brachybacterium sp. Marseille-Q7125 TaxID=2932815 RepID=UPI001FF5227A